MNTNLKNKYINKYYKTIDNIEQRLIMINIVIDKGKKPQL